MFRSFVLFIAGLGVLWTVASQAQSEAVLGQLYGKAVHEYFSNDYAKTYELLTAAIDAGSRDPRAFYFRGLAYMKLGRTPEAKMDFLKGAELESKDINKYYNVGRALERVQGSERQLIETYRIQARMAAFETAEKLRKARYEAIQREEARVLQQQAAEAATPAKESAEPIPPPPAEATEPAKGADANPPAVAPEEKKPAEKKEAGGAMKAEAEPAAEDPFAAKPSTEEKPAAEKKPAVEADPNSKEPAVPEKPTTESKSTAKKSIFSALGKSLTKGISVEEKPRSARYALIISRSPILFDSH